MFDMQRADPQGEHVQMHIFFTSPHAKYDMKFLPLDWFRNTAEIIIPGLEQVGIMHWGRLDWDLLFKEEPRK